MGVSALALANLTITRTKQFIAKLDFISYMIDNAMSPYGSYCHNGFVRIRQNGLVLARCEIIVHMLHCNTYCDGVHF